MKTSLTLQAAVLAVIGSFGTLNKTFSAFDVTTELRRQANAGEVEITDLTIEPIGALNTYRIEHRDIRDLVRESFDNKDFTAITQRAPAGYIEYVTSAPSFLSTTAQPVNQPAATFATGKDDQTTARIVSYVQNKLGVGINPTLKRVQSRLKGTSITTKEIGGILSAKGFNITFNVSAPSLSTVSK